MHRFINHAGAIKWQTLIFSQEEETKQASQQASEIRSQSQQRDNRPRYLFSDDDHDFTDIHPHGANVMVSNASTFVNDCVAICTFL